jgi:ribosomal-protein-alanine N-acetyltransferase
LKTERLILRQLVSSDDNEILALRSDDNVNKYLGRKPGKSIDDAKTFIQTINKNIQRNESIYWAITFNGTDKLIGTICLFDFSDDNLKAEIGYELLPGFQGKGIMQEAISKVINFGIQHIGLNSIEAYTHFENRSSTRLLEKFNFKKHGAVDNNLTIFKLTSDR